MAINNKEAPIGIKAQLERLFPEREIYLRSGGDVRFLKISGRAQKLAACLVALAALAWSGATLAMLAGQADIAMERNVLAQKERDVASSAAQVKKYKSSVGDIAKDLEQRQDFLEDLLESHLGAQLPAVVGEASADVQTPTPVKTSALAPGIGRLKTLEQRQLIFAKAATQLVKARTARTEAAIRSFGLDPRSFSRRAATAQGGPFVPWKGDKDAQSPELKQLSQALAHLDLVERSLLAIPSAKPTATPMLSSSYGYRRDPFNGHAAFHAGLDFPGHMGQPILAAARGKVVFVGRRQGYGNAVEVDHGSGILTRYAHLSGFDVRVGDSVTRGQKIARMGSTGRSTGTHLHFEVRVNGAPVNPRRFLEAKQDVLEVQQTAKQRVAETSQHG